MCSSILQKFYTPRTKRALNYIKNFTQQSINVWTYALRINVEKKNQFLHDARKLRDKSFESN